MTEQFANFATTTLNGAIDNAVTSIVVTSATPFPSSAQYRITIDTEIMIVTAGAGTTTWTVSRAQESTSAASHSNGAAVSHTLTKGGLGTFAPLDSAALTGTPTASTAASTDNSTRLATTGFVVSYLPNGTTAGQAVFWNGTAWIVGIPPTNLGLMNTFLAESMPLESATSTTVNITGTKYVIRVPLPYAVTFTTVSMNVQTPGSGLTSTQNLVAVYNSSGTQVGSTSADQTTAWGTAGLKAATVGSPGSQTGSVYVEILCNAATTPVTFSRGPSPTLFNANLSGANLRASTNGTSATTVDASITPGSLSTSSSPISIWVGLS